MGRWVLGAVVAAISLGGAAVSAQALRDAASPGVSIQRNSSPAQPVPLPPPPVAPGRPGHATPPRSDGAVDLFRAGPRTYAPRFHRRNRDFPYGSVVPFGIGASYYYPYFPAAEPADIEPAPLVEETPGFLRLVIQPETAQVFIDGYFVGGADDFGTARLPIASGLHRVEIRAAGYETMAFDVRIRPYETATFTHALERVEPVVAATPVTTVARAATPKTLYVIPRCYAGDKRPVASQLPAGCNVRALRTIPPAKP
jgi:hypothetical protein